VLEEKNGLYHYYKWEMDAFGNDLPSGNDFLPMDQSGPKEHLTGKMFDTVTGLYYFHARWYDPEVGRFLGTDPMPSINVHAFNDNNPLGKVDPNGQWGYSLHYTYTAMVAGKYFPSCDCADKIAKADQATDEGPTGPLIPFNYEEYHYNNEKAVERMREGTRKCNCVTFGHGLHGHQDHFTHGRYPPPLGHILIGSWPDDELDYRNAAQWRDTRSGTEQYLHLFSQFCGCTNGKFYKK